jgi:hypothetical protein
MTRPPIEYASLSRDYGDAIEYAERRYDWLAGPTGLNVEVIRGLVVSYRIGDLYDSTGSLLPRETLRARFGSAPTTTGREAQEVLRRKRLPPGPISPLDAQRELRAKYRP